METTPNQALLAGAATSALLLLIAPHLFKLWIAIFGGDLPELPGTVPQLIVRYVYGVSSLLIGAALWLAQIGQFWLIGGLFFIAAVGGGVVVMRYISEHSSRLVRQNRMAKENDGDLNGPER